MVATTIARPMKGRCSQKAARVSCRWAFSPQPLDRWEAGAPKRQPGFPAVGPSRYRCFEFLDQFEKVFQRFSSVGYYDVKGRTAASMLLLSMSFTWKFLAPYSGTLAVVGTVLYVFTFSLGAGPVTALILPEIFASRIRAKAVSLSLGMHWISNFFIGLSFLSVVNKFGINTVYLGFSIVCILAIFYISGNVVETKGKSLEEIELALNAAT
ncbi:Plastidic glucose transporter 4 [Senna tora]|uniref:Plastidic glucose transporter 4 n=1 Tax=Senna tora TaxID=362788 RepID=A0A834WBM5_9FABA|nr:Plastidic glucose transporter 4 [Senna tora]